MIMATRPTRCPPDVVLSAPTDADPQYHQDWTIVEGSRWDDEKWERETELRTRRNELIRSRLEAGCSVFFSSSGNSMWPLIQSGDYSTLMPCQAVTAAMAASGEHGVVSPKSASDIGVGDVVFCLIRETQRYYTHFVLEVQTSKTLTKLFRSTAFGV